MNRRKFIYKSTLSAGALLSSKIMANNIFNTLSENTPKMPVVFIGHGSPMNAIEDNLFTKGWAEIAKSIPKPKAILIVSAHWETKGSTWIYSGKKPKMIYDMYGFPQQLYEVNYPAPGYPELANQVSSNVNYTHVSLTQDWGLDHGAWSVLVKMFPDASIPCFQLSLNNTRDLQWHYDLAKELAFLREKGVLILGSGNIVHNLRYMRQFNQPAPDWALFFDDKVKNMIDAQNHKPLIEYEKFGESALISVNSAEHYIPLLYTLALQEKNEEVTYFNHNIGNTLNDVSMRCLRIG